MRGESLGAERGAKWRLCFLFSFFCFFVFLGGQAGASARIANYLGFHRHQRHGIDGKGS